MEALYAHRSQVGERSADNGSEEFVRWMAAETASGTGLGLAEAFKYVGLGLVPISVCRTDEG